MGLERLRLESQLEMELKRVDLTLEAQRREGEQRRNEEDLEAASRWEREVGDSKADADARGVARESERLDAELALALEEKKAAQDAARTQSILVNAVEPDEVRVAVAEDGRLIDFQMTVDRYKSLVNDIYRGRVVNLEAAIGAAFIGEPKE